MMDALLHGLQWAVQQGWLAQSFGYAFMPLCSMR
jgi:zinc transport system permease protein